MIPDAALEQHIAILARTGAGKTVAAKGFVERWLDAGRRVCIVDPTHAWWGLKSGADGMTPGYPVVIFGGPRADVPIDEHSGKTLGRFIGESASPCIIDLSDLFIGQMRRFMAEFAEALFKYNRAPLHLVFDEADTFAPQKPMRDATVMLSRVDRIVRQGRIRGFRVTMISQRPAVINKDVLTQAAVLVAMQITGPQDRKAIEDWIKGQADPEMGRTIIDGLPKLAVGEGWVWAPRLDYLERVRFPMIRTYDSSKAPSLKDAEREIVAAAVDLEQIRKQFAKEEAEAKANDPRRLRARVVELERELQKKAQPQTDPPQLKKAFSDGYSQALHDVAERNRKIIEPFLSDVSERLVAMLGDTWALDAEQKLPPRAAASSPSAAPPPALHADRTAGLPRGEQTVLTAIAQYPNGVTRETLSVLTGYKRSSRDTYLQRLREKGFWEPRGKQIIVTSEGVAVLGVEFDPLPTGAALREHWLARLPEGEKRILETLMDAYPERLPRNELDGATGYKRSSRDTYLQRLRARQLVETIGNAVRASDVLFLEETA